MDPLWLERQTVVRPCYGRWKLSPQEEQCLSSPPVGFSSAIFRCKALESISKEMVCILKGHGIDGH